MNLIVKTFPSLRRLSHGPRCATCGMRKRCHDKAHVCGHCRQACDKFTRRAKDHMTTFDDLVFDRSDSYMARAKAVFANGYTASVITGPYSYGGEQGLYELGVLHNDELCYLTPITDDVIGHLTPTAVTELLARIEALPRDDKCLHAEGHILEMRKDPAGYLAKVRKTAPARSGSRPNRDEGHSRGHEPPRGSEALRRLRLRRGEHPASRLHEVREGAAMTPEDVRQMRQVAYVMAQTACAYAEIEAMKAANEYRSRRNEAQAYSEEAFRAIPEQYGIGHNAAVTTLNRGF